VNDAFLAMTGFSREEALGKTWQELTPEEFYPESRQAVEQALRRDRRQRLDALTTGDGRPLPLHLKTQIRRELDRLELRLEQIRTVEAERDARLERARTVEAAPAPALLLRLKGLGADIAGILWTEGLFRPFANRRQVAALGGLGSHTLEEWID
jgi:transposase